MLDLSHIESFFPEALRPFKRNMLREYLQYKIIELIFRSPWAQSLAFMGGTAIRMIHGNTRFSEDLDFDNRGVDTKSFDELGSSIAKGLTLLGYEVDYNVVTSSAFHLHFRFSRILQETGITHHRDEVLRIQVDAEPQKFDYTPDKVLLSKFDVFVRIAAIPVEILVAQKITCLFTRKRPMGRDAYDIVFLMGKAAPDMRYLHEKLGIGTKDELRKRIRRRCAEIDFKQCGRDVEPFLFAPRDAEKVLHFAQWAEKAF
jgi:predicted nucleotidyltransferase component of viral defense system